MKIAFVSQPWNRIAPPVEIGSISILSYEAARRIAPVHDVEIYAKKDPDQQALETIDGVGYRRIAVGQDRGWARFASRFDKFRARNRPFFSSKRYYNGYIAKVAEDAKHRRPDILQIFNFSQFAPVLKAANPQAKIVLRMSCEWLTQLDPGVIGPRLKSIDAVFGCSEFITNRIKRAFPWYADRCTTILNGRGVPENVPERGPGAAKDKPKRIIYVGRVSPEKGIHVLIEAFGKIMDRFPDLTLDVIGPKSSTPVEFVLGLTNDEKVISLKPLFSGDYAASLESNLAPNMQERVRFRGKVPHGELTTEYLNSDLLVFPSIWDEPSGNPPIEAMALGVPVVSTRTGGTAEYVEDGKTGILVDPGDSAGLADAISVVLEDVETHNRMSAAGAKRVREYLSYERFTGDLIQLYADLLDDRKNRVQ